MLKQENESLDKRLEALEKMIRDRQSGKIILICGLFKAGA